MASNVFIQQKCKEPPKVVLGLPEARDAAILRNVSPQCVLNESSACTAEAGMARGQRLPLLRGLQPISLHWPRRRQRTGCVDGENRQAIDNIVFEVIHSTIGETLNIFVMPSHS